jgi:hypothetical protein
MDNFYRKLSIEAGIAVVIVAALLGGIVAFASRVNASLDEITTARAELMKRWSSLNSLASLITDYNDRAKGALITMQQMVPVQDQIFNLSRDFQALASRSGVSTGFSFVEEKAPSDEDLGSVRYTLSARGNLDALYRFEKQVEQFKYLSTVESVGVEWGSEASSMNIHGQIFFRK